MKLEKLFDTINLNGATISKMEENLIKGTLKINVINRLSEFDVDYLGDEINDLEVVEISVTFSGIRYICMDFDKVEERVIIGVLLGNLESDDMIMIKTFDAESELEEYNELYVRGEDVEVEWKILRRIASYQRY